MIYSFNSPIPNFLLVEIDFSSETVYHLLKCSCFKDRYFISLALYADLCLLSFPLLSNSEPEAVLLAGDDEYTSLIFFCQ